MFRLWKAGTTEVLVGLGLAAFAAPVWGANPGVPGAINYVEGQVSLDGQALTQHAVGSSQVETGQVLETQHGRAELLLTPGVFLRLGDNSAIRMDNPGLTNTDVAVLRGEALVEVTQLYKENNLQVADNGATVSILKKGLYDFNATAPRVEVYDGEAQVREGDAQVKVKKGREAVLGEPTLKAEKFDRHNQDALYAWSNLRSEYMGEASAESARVYVNNGPGWFGGGWYWNPWFSAYSFIPGDGLLYSPFGWGFYSPSYAYYAPIYRGGGYYARSGGRGVVGTAAVQPRISGFRRAPAVSMRSGGFASPRMSGGFSGGGFARGAMGGGRRR